jgi:nucleoside-diphosphate-sugar epimerase
MKFLVTGGAGFIGNNVVRQLELLGHESFIIDNCTNYGFIPQEELDSVIRERKRRMKAGVHHIDIRNRKEVESWFKSFGGMCQGIIHFASLPRQKIVNRDPVMGAEVMNTALIHLLELSKQFKLKKFIYISSSMVYGDFDDGVTELSACNPIGQYAILKYTGEELVKDYTRRGCFDSVIVRPSAVYGERDCEDRVVSKFLLGAMRGETLKVNGENEYLDFTHVDDAAKGIVLATLNGSGTYNIARGKSVRLLDAAQMAIDITGKGTIQVQNKDINFPSRGALSIAKAYSALNFDPKIDLDVGLARYHEWITKNAYWTKRLK